MEQKAHLHNKYLLGLVAFYMVIICSCQNVQKPTKPLQKAIDFTIDTTLIPHDTVFVHDKMLALENGIYWYSNKKYAGIIKELYPNGKLKKQFSVYQGMLHGTYKSFYENEKPWEIRSYKNNLSTGKHYGFWVETGKPKFEYTYYEERKEGLQRKWYINGSPFLALNYVNDHEEGLQKGWRENGKPFLNYEVKDGFVYGLQKAALCYSLKDEKFNSK
jgi:antitoxin component YwqK of YwqJK toxin-antitoxin module